MNQTKLKLTKVKNEETKNFNSRSLKTLKGYFVCISDFKRLEKIINPKNPFVKSIKI